MVTLEVDRWLEEQAPPADLAGILRCSWRGELAGFRLPLPDECLDLTWVDDGTLWLSGPESRSWAPGEPTGAMVAGVRFAPGVGPAVVGVTADEVCDRRAPLAALWGDRTVRRLAEQLAQQPDDRGRIRLLETVVRTRAATVGPPDPVVARLWAAIGQARRRPPSVAEAARSAGLSERQLRRRCRAAFGYGPARLARIVRMQRLVRTARIAERISLVELAVTAGYADQQHLAHDVSDLFGVTPSALLGTASDRYKTGPGGALT